MPGERFCRDCQCLGVGSIAAEGKAKPTGYGRRLNVKPSRPQRKSADHGLQNGVGGSIRVMCPHRLPHQREPAMVSIGVQRSPRGSQFRFLCPLRHSPSSWKKMLLHCANRNAFAN